MIFYHKQRKQFIIIANYFTFTNYVNEIDTRLLDYSRLGADHLTLEGGGG